MEIMLLAVPFVTSVVMFAVKRLAGLAAVGNGPDQKFWLRVILIVTSLFGVAATAGLNGTPIDENSVSDLVEMFIETGVTAYFSHAFYNSAFRR